MSEKEKKIRISLINDVFHYIGIPKKVELIKKENGYWGVKGGNGMAETDSMIGSIRRILIIYRYNLGDENNSSSKKYNIGTSCIRDLLRKFKEDYNIKDL